MRWFHIALIGVVSMLGLQLAAWQGLAVRSVATSADEVQVVETVDVHQYAGKWYEIAFIPNSFQNQCVRDTTAEYALAEDGLIQVINSCTTADGKRDAVEGRARAKDPRTPAKLEVTFAHVFDWIWLASGDYWIIDLDPAYSYSVVGHPSRDYGWILSRSPMIDDMTLNKLAKGLENQGYDLCKFQMSLQAGGNQNAMRLCDRVNP